MTEQSFDAGLAPPTSPKPTDALSAGGFSRLAHLAGAVVSLALVVGVGVWGYKIVARDVSGVPVVRAMDGPMRVQPPDPGGRLADHQGLAVNRIAASGTADAPPDRVRLAAPGPGLAPEDEPMGALSGDRPTREDVVIPDDSPLAQRDAADNPELEDLLASLQSGVDPLAGDGSGLDGLRDLDPPGQGPARSLRPRQRPVALGGPAGQDAADTGPQVVEIAADTIPPGTRLVQIGAYDSAETARDEWNRLLGRFDAYLGEKDRVIQRASAGGRVFFRLRAHGFTDLSDARRFCSALVAEGQDCIPVVAR